jgi:hypothetical protein
MSVVLPAGQTGIDASQMLVTGSSFRNSYMMAEIQQGRLDGHFDSPSIATRLRLWR